MMTMGIIQIYDLSKLPWLQPSPVAILLIRQPILSFVDKVLTQIKKTWVLILQNFGKNLTMSNPISSPISDAKMCD